jgi:long-chain acyl-CoA synthetase
VNVTRVFTQNATVEKLTHVRSATVQVSRTFSEMVRNVACLSAELRRRGITPGDRILILCGSRVEAVESILAAFNLGAVAMPVTPLIGKTNVLAIIRDMTPSCCIFEDAPEPDARAALEARGCLMVAMKHSDAAASLSWIHYQRLLDAGPAAIAFPDYPEEQPALVIHSSGSSGSLKAVAMSHGALLRYFEYHNFVWSQYSDGPDSLAATSPMLTGLPVSHLAGLSICLQGLMNGRRTYLLSVFLPELYLRLIEQTRCAFIFLVPSLYRSLLKEPYLRTMDKSALRACIVAGEACAPELFGQIEAAFGVPLLAAYSMTECLSGIGHSRRDLFGRRAKRLSCGRQLFGELKLSDARGNENPSDGELWVRNETVHACYLQPYLNESRMRDGWFRTGDLFHRDVEGNFYYRGRADDMFVCNGKNIHPLEIEALLMRHEAVESVCAVPVTTAEKGVVPAALVVAKQPVSEAELQEFFSRIGPSHAIPQFVKLVDAVPLLGPGKTDRRRTAQMLQATYDERRAQRLERTATEVPA